MHLHRIDGQAFSALRFQRSQPLMKTPQSLLKFVVVGVLVGAMATMSSCSNTEKKNPPSGASVPLKDTHRTYNPDTHRYEEPVPWGARGNN